MKINGNQVRRGHIILHEGGLWKVQKTQATKTGKSGAYNQVEMKNIISGTKLNMRYRASESVERARLEEKDYTFLYASDPQFVFMDADTFEQIEVSADTIGESASFLAEGMSVRISFYENTPIDVALPEQVTVTVSETEPVIKGQTASASYKPALLENGLRITVPQFVAPGERITVDTREVAYVGRAED